VATTHSPSTNRFVIAVLIAAVFGAGRLAADDDDLTPVPNRPTASTTAESIKAGVFEIEAGVEAASDHETLGTLLKLGVFDRLELWVGPTPFLRAEMDTGHESGIGDTLAGAKLRFIDQKGNIPSIGILYVAKLPTASDDLGPGKVDDAFTLLVSKDLGKVHVDVNVGPDFTARSAASGFDEDFFGAVAVSYSVSKRWGVSGEISGFTSAEDGVPGATNLLGAATFSPSSRLVLDAAVSVSVHGDQPRITVLSGLTYSVGHVFRR
jgi:hypothetical protein